MDWDLFFKKMVLECGIQPSEFPNLTRARFFALLYDEKQFEPKEITQEDAIAYARAYQQGLKHSVK